MLISKLSQPFSTYISPTASKLFLRLGYFALVFSMVFFPAQSAKASLDIRKFLMMDIRHGLTTKDKSRVLPCIYSEVEYLGNGLFFTSPYIDTTTNNKTQSDLSHKVFTKSGRELPILVPAGSRFRGICWLGKQSDSTTELDFDSLPADALFIYLTDKGSGICDKDGTSIFSPDDSFVGVAYDGKALISKGPQKSERFCFDCETHAISKFQFPKTTHSQNLNFSDERASYAEKRGEDWLYGYVDWSGETAITPQFIKAGPFFKNLATVTLPSKTEVVIDKAGNLASPEDLEVKQFYGDFAVARNLKNAPGLWGVVDRSFKFVIAPKYFNLSPIALPSARARNQISQGYKYSPLGYWALKTENGQQERLSLDGKSQLTLPEGCRFQHERYDGSMECQRQTDEKNIWQGVIVSKDGKIVEDKVELNELGLKVRYIQVSKDRLVELVVQDRPN